jgi:hypothetical protein
MAVFTAPKQPVPPRAFPPPSSTKPNFLLRAPAPSPANAAVLHPRCPRAPGDATRSRAAGAAEPMGAEAAAGARGAVRGAAEAGRPRLGRRPARRELRPPRSPRSPRSPRREKLRRRASRRVLAPAPCPLPASRAGSALAEGSGRQPGAG